MTAPFILSAHCLIRPCLYSLSHGSPPRRSHVHVVNSVVVTSMWWGTEAFCIKSYMSELGRWTSRPSKVFGNCTSWLLDCYFLRDPKIGPPNWIALGVLRLRNCVRVNVCYFKVLCLRWLVTQQWLANAPPFNPISFYQYYPISLFPSTDMSWKRILICLRTLIISQNSIPGSHIKDCFRSG